MTLESNGKRIFITVSPTAYWEFTNLDLFGHDQCRRVKVQAWKGRCISFAEERLQLANLAAQAAERRLQAAKADNLLIEVKINFPMVLSRASFTYFSINLQ